MKTEITDSNNHFRILETSALKFLLDRIAIGSSQRNEMVSSEWKEYLRIKRTENFSQERLDNFADPNYKLTYGLYGGTTNDKITLAHRLYQGDNIYQEILQIKEPDIGNPPKKFTLKNQSVSGNFLRQVYFAYRLLKGLKRPPTTVVEIGGGYGLLAYILRTLFPQCKIAIVDIPETILLQHHFLKNVFPNITMGHISGTSDTGKRIECGPCDVTFVECNSLNLLNVEPDIVLALASLQEMTAPIVDYYAGWVEANICKDGLFYMYNCYGMDEESYKNPAKIRLDDKWVIVHLEQPTLIEDDYRHLEAILQRTDRVDSHWSRKKDYFEKYYEALRAWDHENMAHFSQLLLNGSNG